MIRTLLAGLAAAFAFIAAPSGAQEVSRLDRILQSGTLRVGTTGDYKPFTSKDPATGNFRASTLTRRRRWEKRSASRSSSCRPPGRTS